VTLSLAGCAAVQMIYNTAVFGGPLNLGYSNSELWVKQHHTGFMSLTLPQGEAAWGITFGVFRGLFVLSPLLLLALPGLALWWRSGQRRPEFWVTATSVLAMLLFNSSSSMWWGGFAVGPRYLLPALPFMALPLAWVFIAWGHQAWLKGITLLLSGWSLVATWGLTLAGQAFPSDTIRNPLVEYAWPNWQQGNLARNLGTVLGLHGLWSLAPLILLLVLFGLAWWLANRRRTGTPPSTI
jgi:branched-subunit amino acid ABC-type transport system permease component